jgi:hypothetical protein
MGSLLLSLTFLGAMNRFGRFASFFLGGSILRGEILIGLRLAQNVGSDLLFLGFVVKANNAEQVKVVYRGAPWMISVAQRRLRLKAAPKAVSSRLARST